MYPIGPLHPDDSYLGVQVLLFRALLVSIFGKKFMFGIIYFLLCISVLLTQDDGQLQVVAVRSVFAADIIDGNVNYRQRLFVAAI